MTLLNEDNEFFEDSSDPSTTLIFIIYYVVVKFVVKFGNFQPTTINIK
jgi:hypothetical protein